MGTTIRVSESQHEKLEYIKELSNQKWNRHPNYNPSFKDAIDFIMQETKLNKVVAKQTRNILKEDPEKAKELLEYSFMTENKLMEIAERSRSLDEDEIGNILAEKSKYIESISEKDINFNKD